MMCDDCEHTSPTRVREAEEVGQRATSCNRSCNQSCTSTKSCNSLNMSRVTSVKTKHNQDLCYYKFLHFLGKVFAILPNFNLDHFEHNASNNCYATIVLVLLCGIYVFTTYGKVQNMKSVFAPSVFITEIASDAVVVTTNIVTIIRINMVKGRKICKLLSNLSRIDSELRILNEDLVIYPLKQFVGELTFILVFFVLFWVYNIYIWMATVGWTIFRFFALRDLGNFQVVVAALVLSGYATAIRNRARIMNDILMTIHPNSDGDTALFVRSSAESKCAKEREATAMVKKLRSVFVHLVQALDDYNNVFGWVHLVLYVTIVITLLNPINLALVYGVGDRLFPGAEFDFRLVLLCLIWAALPGLIATWIFSACDQCISDIKKIPNICNCLVQEYPKESETTEQLEKLAQQVVNSCPEFTAAGFFTVNYNIYFSLIGSITTYLIVLIQFR